MFAMALVTVVAGLFGMNLYNKAEDSYVAFILVRLVARSRVLQATVYPESEHADAWLASAAGTVYLIACYHASCKPRGATT